MIKKTLMILVLAVFISAPAFGVGLVPESDCVGLDPDNIFHGPVDDSVMANNAINNDSDFTALMDCTEDAYGEYFAGTGSFPSTDTCFDDYQSILTSARNTSVYTWKIVLQMKPKTDLDLTIRDCVLEWRGDTIWKNASQTGSFRDRSGALIQVQGANPSIAVVALPGPLAEAGFPVPMIMDAKKHPSLDLISLDEVLYTSKGLWAEAIVLDFPDFDKTNLEGQALVPLKQGDMINVRISIPRSNSTDIRYGEDNVEIQYVGYEVETVTATQVANFYGCEIE
jgi:hypothetical protein